MSTRKVRIRNSACSLIATALLCAAAGASAQTVYRQVDTAGRITFTDLPDAAATTAPARAATVSSMAVANALASNSPIRSRSADAIDASEAARRLGQAQLERERGAELLSGEQVEGLDTDAAPHRYLRRQAKLQRALEQAKLRYSETRQPRSVAPKARPKDAD